MLGPGGRDAIRSSSTRSRVAVVTGVVRSSRFGRWKPVTTASSGAIRNAAQMSSTTCGVAVAVRASTRSAPSSVARRASFR